jgi:[protein-PII] uridylyltransferase
METKRPIESASPGAAESFESRAKALRNEYQRTMLEIRGAFEAGASGTSTLGARAAAVDRLVCGLWQANTADDPKLKNGIVLVAIGGYGRRELFPYSDVDLLYLLDAKIVERDVKSSLRRVSQELWDIGLRVSPATRKLAECERFSDENAEFTVSLLDHRLLLGDTALYRQLAEETLPRLLERDGKSIVSRLLRLTEERHAKYGETLFHLEPNVKDCPGGLRDVHVCAWLRRLGPKALNRGVVEGNGTSLDPEFRAAVEFMRLVRCFLHYRHDRDDNTLDWQAQDAAAKTAIGLPSGANSHIDAAYWMRLYFRHARSIDRGVNQRMEEAAPLPKQPKKLLGLKNRPAPVTHQDGFRVERGTIVLDRVTSGNADDFLHESGAVLRIFAAMAGNGWRLSSETEERLSQALPFLSANLEEGPALWHHLEQILAGEYAGLALRAMHVLGILELLIPEFHGIDALVVRDAYHRYTVDEHTFVLIDTLHNLEKPQTDTKAEWTTRFGAILRELPHPGLLYLAALLHDTGKGRSTGDHALESARMARSVVNRLELDSYESGLVLGLITNHLEMSATLRRDIFDAETVAAFAAKVQTPEALRMLTLLTYADINAVHPDALTPWKAENIWRLYIATSNYLDRSVDDERVSAQQESELIHSVAALLPGSNEAEIAGFLEGFPERYVRTRTAQQVRTQFEMAQRMQQDRVQLDFRYKPDVSELTVVTPDRALLFANMTGALAAWGMNIVTADAFSNRQGVVVDSFRFTDTFRTLEMNASEHERFVKSIHDVMTGEVPVEKLLSGRRRGRRQAPMVEVETRIDFDDEASSHSTLLEVVTQDLPGLLRALSLTLAAAGCNIEVALIDTEGEMAIDVFYLTRDGAKLEKKEQRQLRTALLQALEENAR